MNQNWHAETRPILEASWRCWYLLKMLARLAEQFDDKPSPMPWVGAAVLYPYGIH